MSTNRLEVPVNISASKPVYYGKRPARLRERAHKSLIPTWWTIDQKIEALRELEAETGIVAKSKARRRHASALRGSND